LGARCIQMRLATLGEAAKVEVTPHVLRHTFATRLLREVNDVKFVCPICPLSPDGCILLASETHNWFDCEDGGVAQCGEFIRLHNSPMSGGL